VHANYSDLPSARGVGNLLHQLFFPRPTRKIWKRGPKQTGQNKHPVTAALSPWSCMRGLSSRAVLQPVCSVRLRNFVADNPGLRDRGVKEASYVVLTETAMPGILAEVSFVSSPADEQKLRSDGYREQIAQALYRGIARYATAPKGVKVASAANRAECSARLRNRLAYSKGFTMRMPSISRACCMSSEKSTLQPARFAARRIRSVPE